METPDDIKTLKLEAFRAARLTVISKTAENHRAAAEAWARVRLACAASDAPWAIQSAIDADDQFWVHYDRAAAIESSATA